jgi:hypothetical protein
LYACAQRTWLHTLRALLHTVILLGMHLQVTKGSPIIV